MLRCACVCVCVQHAGVALSSLIRALDELKMVAIVRYTYDRRSNPQVGAAFPCIKRKYEVSRSHSDIRSAPRGTTTAGPMPPDYQEPGRLGADIEESYIEES